MTRHKVAVSFVNSLEDTAKTRSGVITRSSSIRRPDAKSVVWVNKLRSGVSEEKVAEDILDSPMYQSAHRDSNLFIHDLYIDVLGRQGGSAEVARWQRALSSGIGRQAIVASFVESAEAVDQVVDSFYTAYLHRQPDQATSKILVNMLESPHGSASEVASRILSGHEFQEDATTSRG